MSVQREGGCCLRRGPLPAEVRPALHALLPLPELPASDRQRLRHQRPDRDRPRGATCRRAAVCRRVSQRRQEAEDLALHDLPGRGLQPVHESPRAVRSRAARSTTLRALRRTFTSSRGPSSPGSRSRSRCRHSTSTTTRRSCGRRKVSSDSRRSWRRRTPAPERAHGDSYVSGLLAATREDNAVDHARLAIGARRDAA